MMKYNCCRSNLLFLIILLVPYNISASLTVTKIPETGYCADEQCLKPIAIGSTSIAYQSIDPHVLSCKASSDVTIFTKKTDDNRLFRLVEINGKRGFFPPRLLRETKAKVLSDEINVPVQFVISDRIIVKALSNESSDTTPIASNIASSIESNIQETLTPTSPSKDSEYKGFLFAHASAAEPTESQTSDFAPGTSPQFPSVNKVAVDTTSPVDTCDPSKGDCPIPVLENKNSETTLDIDSTPKDDTKSETGESKERTDGDLSTEKSEDISEGDDEDDEEEDDDDIEVQSESIEDYSEPIIPSLKTSINEKTEDVDSGIVTPSLPEHPSTFSESVVVNETPIQTPHVSSDLPPVASSEPPSPIHPSKPQDTQIPRSDITIHPVPVQSELKQGEPASNESLENSVAAAPHPSSSETLLTPQTDRNVQANLTEVPGDPKTASDGNSTVEKLDLSQVPDTPSTKQDVNLTDGSSPQVTTSSDVNDHVSGEGSPVITSTDAVALQNETIGTSEAETSQSNDQSYEQISVPTTGASPSIDNETAETGGTPLQMDTLPVQNINSFYRPPLGLGQPAAQPVNVPSNQPNVGQHQHQSPFTGQQASEPLAVNQNVPPSSLSPATETVPTSPLSPVAQDYQPPPPSPDDLGYSQPQTSSPIAQQNLPPSSPSPDDLQYPQFSTPSPDALQSEPPTTPSPDVQDYQLPTIPSPHIQDYQLPPASSPDAQEYQTPSTPSPGALPIDTSDLYNNLSPTIPSGLGEAEHPVVDSTSNIVVPPEGTSASPDITPGDSSPEPVADYPEVTEASPSLWDSFLSLFSSSGTPVDSPQAEVPAPGTPVQPEQIGSYPGYPPQQDVPPKVEIEGSTCPDGSVGPDCPQESAFPFQVEDLIGGFGVDSLVTRVIAAAVTLLLCIIAYFFFENRRMDGTLVARVNTLERELMVLSKENALLKEECSSNIGQGQLEVFLEELKEAKAARADLEEQVATLERDLDEAAEANMELNQMLAQTLENPKGSTDDVIASVERLQAQLDGQRDTIGKMTRSLSSKNTEIEGLKIQLTECRETISGLEAEVATLNEAVAYVRREKEDAIIAHVEKLQEVQNQLDEALANKVLEESRFVTELSSVKLNLKKTRQVVVAKESEVESLKESLKELKSNAVSEEKIQKLFDAVKLHAQVEQLTQERDELEDSLRGEGDARKRLEDHVRVIEEEVNKLRVNYEEAQKEKAEAQTRLEVLSNYFKEKEAQLKKELDLQEILLAQQRGDENSVLRQVKSLQEEVETYRSQNESMKREILDQERELKGQIATIEKKSHDNWVSARQAERKLEESRQEASQLRNRLTVVEKNLSSSGEPVGVEANGEGGVISPVMGLPGMGPMGALMGPMGPLIPPPPPPIDLDASSGLPFMFPPLSPGSMPSHPHFIPPLPPPLLAGDRRPPPLGRMSSPPPAPQPPGHFSPPPPHFDRLDRPSQSPSPTYHRSPAGAERQGFRPFAKPNPRKPTDYRGAPATF